MLQRLLNASLTGRQLLHLALSAAVLVGVPYLAIGMVWAMNHHEHLTSSAAVDRVFSLLGEVVAWPVLLIANVTLI